MKIAIYRIGVLTELINKERIRLANKYKVTRVLMNAQPAEDNQGWTEVSSTIYAANLRDTYEEIVFIIEKAEGGRVPLKIGDVITLPDAVSEYHKE